MGPPKPYASDVYALGVVFWEIATRKMPWQGKNMVEILSAVGNRGARPGIPQDATVPQVQAAIAACWVQDATSRASAADVEIAGFRCGQPACTAAPRCSTAPRVD